MHPFALYLTQVYLDGLRSDAAAHRQTADMARRARRPSDPGRLESLRRALGTISLRVGPRPIDLPAAG